jgi:hypothetical protein
VSYKAKRQKVGASKPRTYHQIEADPMATADELEKLAKWDKVRAFKHPNCPAHVWWNIARDYPIEAPETLAGALFLLETPARWIDLEEDHAHLWVNRHVEAEHPRCPLRNDLLLFATDCVEHVMPIWEKTHAEDDRPRVLIQTVRDWIRGKATMDTLKAARQEGSYAISAVRSAAQRVAYAANKAALVTDPFDAAGGAAGFAAEAANEWANECVWQWHRLKEYIAGTAQVGARSLRSKHHA